MKIFVCGKEKKHPCSFSSVVIRDEIVKLEIIYKCKYLFKTGIYPMTLKM